MSNEEKINAAINYIFEVQQDIKSVDPDLAEGIDDIIDHLNVLSMNF